MAMSYEATIANTLLDIARAASNADLAWALIGGEALTAHGVPRHSTGVDLLVPPDSLEALAAALGGPFYWTPVAYDPEKRMRCAARAITLHEISDPLLAEIGEPRRMIPMRSYTGILVDLYAAQHAIEREIVDSAVIREHHAVRIYLAPLGGVLLSKAKLARNKDLAAIEQTTEHLAGAVLDEAIGWARARDAGAAATLEQVVRDTQARLTPIRVTTREKP